jgi:hypothetical protein
MGHPVRRSLSQLHSHHPLAPPLLHTHCQVCWYVLREDEKARGQFLCPMETNTILTVLALAQHVMLAPVCKHSDVYGTCFSDVYGTWYSDVYGTCVQTLGCIYTH